MQFIDSLLNYEKTSSFSYPQAMELGRMRALAAAWGDPHNAYESVLIAGSKGKGSTAAILASILNAAGIPAGLYTSPHLSDVRERIQVGGCCIPERHFVELVSRMSETLAEPRWKKDPLTYFETLTTIALEYFRSQGVRVAVLEVGLGGLLDSTNIAPAKVAGITPISLEHTDKLGCTIAEIAAQKAGIIKGGETVISAEQPPAAAAVIQKAAKAGQAKLVSVGKEITVTGKEFGENFQTFDLHTPYGDFDRLKIGLLGEHQMKNAAQAVVLAKALECRAGLRISEGVVRKGLKAAHWPGRLEVIANCPTVVLDGAHNADSAQKLKAALARHFRFERLIVVLGVSGDKDLRGILDAVAPSARFIVATQSSHARARAAEEVAKAAGVFKAEVFLEKESFRAFEKANRLATPQDLLLVTGSLFLVGEAGEYWRR